MLMLYTPMHIYIYILLEHYFNMYIVYYNVRCPVHYLAHRSAVKSMSFWWHLLFTVLLCTITMHFFPRCIMHNFSTMHYALHSTQYMHCFVDFEYNAAFLSIPTPLPSHNESAYKGKSYVNVILYLEIYWIWRIIFLIHFTVRVYACRDVKSDSDDR